MIEGELAAAFASDHPHREKEPSVFGREAPFIGGFLGGLKLPNAQVQEGGRLSEEETADMEEGVANAAINFLGGWTF
jgi:hypothetical protein